MTLGAWDPPFYYISISLPSLVNISWSFGEGNIRINLKPVDDFQNN